MHVTRIDQIILEKNGGHNLISLEEWGELKTSERIHLILERKVNFFSNGAKVDAKTAVTVLLQQLAP
ncbi:MAG: hypothetical protein AAF492_03600 [Verrucomicrobiota bacterium]